MNRCRSLTPSIDIPAHVKKGTVVKVANNTLDGITFQPEDAAALEAEFGGRMRRPDAAQLPKPGKGPFSFDVTRLPRPANASMISMTEDPAHWALKISFGATPGVGFREQWQPPPVPKTPLLPTLGYASKRFSLGFGEATGKPLVFSALHAAVTDNLCYIHIDERGFVVNTPDGAVVTPTVWGHLANELLLKTIFRDWLDGKVGNSAIGKIVVEAVNRVALRFPDAENGFAGLEGRVNDIAGLTDLKGIATTFLPIGVSAALVHLRNSTVEANFYWHDGERTVTIGWGGNWGSK